MFTITTAERNAVKGTSLDQYVILEIQDPDLAWVNVSEDLDYPDWFISASVADSIDANTMTFQATLVRGVKEDPTDPTESAETLSLAPFREDSTINRDSLGAYSPMLDLVRMWRIRVSVVTDGGTPDLKEIAKGYIDEIAPDDFPSTIQISGRGEEAQILSVEILEIRTYSVGTTDDMETVIQALLNDNMDDPPTLYVPVASSFIINEYEQDYGNLYTAIQNVAGLVGGLVRYMYDSAGVNRLTLFFPPRDAEPGDEDWTIGPDEYLRLPVNRISILGVRNFVPVRYNDSGTSAVETVVSPVTGTSPSITRYGRQSLPIDLSSDTQILDATSAQALADAIRHDLEYPSLEQRPVSYGLWFVQLCDYVKLLPNGVHYNEPKYGGVKAFTHEMSNAVIRTSVDLGASPAGGYARWIPMARKRLMRVPTEGPIFDPLLPFFTPPPEPAPGALAASITGNARILVLPGGESGEGSTLTFGNVYIPPVCTSALSGLAIDDDFQFTVCEVTTDADVKSYSSQYTSAANKWQSPYAAGKKFSHILGVEVVDDGTSANLVRHVRLYDPPSHIDSPLTYPTNTRHNIKAIFPADSYPNFWMRVFARNMHKSTTEGLIALKTQDRWDGSFAIDASDGVSFYRHPTDSKIYLQTESAGSPAPGPSGTDDGTPLTSVAVADSDMVELMLHIVLGGSPVLTDQSGKVVRWSVSVDAYVRINSGVTIYSRSQSQYIWQPYFAEATSGPLVPWALTVHEPPISNSLTEIHGYEFVNNADSVDPFNVI